MAKSQEQLTGITQEEIKQRAILYGSYRYFEEKKDYYFDLLSDEDQKIVLNDRVGYVKIYYYDALQVVKKAFFKLYNKAFDDRVYKRYLDNFLIIGDYLTLIKDSRKIKDKGQQYFINHETIKLRHNQIVDKEMEFEKKEKKKLQEINECENPKVTLFNFFINSPINSQTQSNRLATSAFNGLTCSDSGRSTDALTNQQPEPDTEAVKVANLNE